MTDAASAPDAPSAGDAGPRSLTVPAATLHALRAAVLADADGERRLRDAGYVAGVAMYDDYAAYLQTGGPVDPASLPIDRFVAALREYLADCGYGTVHIDARASTNVLRLSSADWIEATADRHATYPTCHFTTGLLAGFLGRVAGEPLAVLEVSCQSSGADACTFVVGSRAVMDDLWEELRAQSAERTESR